MASPNETAVERPYKSYHNSAVAALQRLTLLLLRRKHTIVNLQLNLPGTMDLVLVLVIEIELVTGFVFCNMKVRCK